MSCRGKCTCDDTDTRVASPPTRIMPTLTWPPLRMVEATPLCSLRLSLPLVMSYLTKARDGSLGLWRHGRSPGRFWALYTAWISDSPPTTTDPKLNKVRITILINIKIKGNNQDNLLPRSCDGFYIAVCHVMTLQRLSSQDSSCEGTYNMQIMQCKYTHHAKGHYTEVWKFKGTPCNNNVHVVLR